MAVQGSGQFALLVVPANLPPPQLARTAAVELQARCDHQHAEQRVIDVIELVRTHAAVIDQAVGAVVVTEQQVQIQVQESRSRQAHGAIDVGCRTVAEQKLRCAAATATALGPGQMAQRPIL